MDDIDPITLTIRSATPSDYEVCLELDHTVSTEYVWQMMLDDNEGEFTVTFRAARLPRSMKVQYPRQGESMIESWRQHTAFLVAESEGMIVGYANIREEPTQEVAWIADMAVDSSQRLQGVGSALLKAVRGWAIEHNLRGIIAETQTKNYPSIRFFQRRGLVFCGFNDHYYPNQDIAVFFGQILR